MKKCNVEKLELHGSRRYSLSPSSPVNVNREIVRVVAKLLFPCAALVLLLLSQTHLAQSPVSAPAYILVDPIDAAARKKQKIVFSSDAGNVLTRALENAYSNCRSTEITVGKIVRSALSADCVINDRPAAEYRFSGKAGQKISILMSVADGAGLDPFLYLLRNGKEIASNDDFGTGLDARIGGTGSWVVLPADDVYSIRATSFDRIGGRYPATGAFRLSLNTDNGADSDTLAPAGFGVFSTGSIATPIPDAGAGFVDIPINVSEFSGTVNDINVRVRLNHTFVGDLELSLISPNNIQVPLSTRNGGGGDNYGAGANNCTGTKTVFDDEAGTPITAGTAPFAGVFRPQGALSDFDTVPTSGTWRLRIQDAAAADVGVVGCVELEIDRATGPACTYSVSLGSGTISSINVYWRADGDELIGFNVNTQPGCIWSVVNQAPGMLAIDSGGGQNAGSGAFSYHAQLNSGPRREGTILINTPSGGLSGFSATNYQDSFSPPCSQTTISLPQTVSNQSLTTNDCAIYGSYTKRYAFSGSAGQQISISMAASGFTPRIRLKNGNSYVPGGGGFGSPSPFTFTLPQSDTTYIIEAASSALLPGISGTGSFTLALDLVGVQSFPITGRVTEGSTNVGVPGVIINVPPIIPIVPIVTDANGFYTHLPRPPGTYTVAPSQPGYTFTPPSQTVTITNGPPPPVNFQRNIPAPVISALVPNETQVGVPVTVTVNGSNFAAGASVLYGGQTRAASSISQTSLQFTLAAADVATTGPRNVQVVNPASSGGSSNILQFRVVDPVCPLREIAYGQAVNGALNNKSCLVGQQRTDIYTFTGAANDEIAITLDSPSIQPFLQLAAPDGSILATESGQILARIPSSGFIRLTTSGIHRIKVSSAAALGPYMLTLTPKPSVSCNYTLSPASTNIPPAGGTGFSFDILSGDGCPSTSAAVGPNSSHIHIVSNAGGRVTFSVDAHNGNADRSGTIIAGQQTHTVRQFGTAAPANDFFAQATALLPGPCSGKGGLCVIEGRNTGASTEPGEPIHAGVPSPLTSLSGDIRRSVWYKWTAPASGTYSFTTSGSTFDTVLAIYTGPTVGNLAFVARNDDTTNFDATSKINFIATAGTEYKIAVEGKNGDSGSIQLGYSAFRRLFRLYLQNYNGFASNIDPETVFARREGTGPAIAGNFVSQGVYEFDLPDDNADYIATISGPEGIVWEPPTYTIRNSLGAFNEMMANPNGGSGTGNGQNQVSNPTSSIPKRFTGWINGISTLADLALLKVYAASTGSNSAVPPKLCEVPGLTTVNGVTRAVYVCKVQPGTKHQVIPSALGRAFAVPVLEIGPLNNNTGPDDTPPFLITATTASTHSISGRVAAAGQGLEGVTVRLASGLISLEETTGPNGNYAFPNLAPGTYTLAALRPGYTFGGLPPVILQNANATVDITAVPCSFSIPSVPAAPSSGGVVREFLVNANPGSEGCAWNAQVAPGFPWISINAGSGVGNGRVQYTLQANPGTAPRSGTILVGSQTVVISQNGTGTSRTLFDYDGDGRADVSVRRPGDNFWYLQQSTVGFTGRQWGIAGDRIAPADFDGDGKTDLAVFRPSEGVWYVIMSQTGTLRSFPWGANGDVPVPADHNADGKADLVVYRPSNNTFYMMNPVTSLQFGQVQFGIAGDKAVIGDFDNDGRWDVAVFRPSNNFWYVRLLSGDYTAQQFGEAGDIPVPADYDGDRKTDPAVFRPSTGTWYRWRSNGGGYDQVGWGQNGDVPVAADYDGDGRADCAVFRPSENIWYLHRTTAGLIGIQFGQNGDGPTPAAFLQ